MKKKKLSESLDYVNELYIGYVWNLLIKLAEKKLDRKLTKKELNELRHEFAKGMSKSLK
jgi:hypothetical protein